MERKGIAGGKFKPLSRRKIRKFQEATVRLLQDPGMDVHNKEALKIFKKNGARVKGERVKIPEFMLKDALEHAPSEASLYGRKRKHNLRLGGKKVYLGTGGTTLQAIDLEGELRPTTSQDVAEIARLVDALEDIHFFVIPVFPNDASESQADVTRFYHSLANTTKHVMGGVYTLEGINDVIRMAEKIAGGAEELRDRPFISMISCVISPLTMDDTYAGFTIKIAREGIPLAIPAEPMAGATSPATIAATVLQSNVESLAGLVLAQLVNPGCPVLCGTVASIMDMTTTSYIAGSIESALINSALAQLNQSYEVPFYATAGMSDSKLPDIQAGYEKAATATMTALAGANFIHDAAGLIEFSATVAYEQYVIDAEIIGNAMRAVRGIKVNEDTIAEKLIRKVGPGGNFLTAGHTRAHFRKEFHFPFLSDRQKREEWKRQGSKDASTRARETARDILKRHNSRAMNKKLKKQILKEFPNVKT